MFVHLPLGWPTGGTDFEEAGLAWVTPTVR
jgi:hypothetical protein